MSFLNFLKPESLVRGKTFRVKILSAVMANEWNERRASHREPGDVIEVDESVAHELLSSNRAQLLEPTDKNGVHIERRKRPEKNKPAPIPANFSNLPPVFIKAWEGRAKWDALYADVRDLKQACGNDPAFHLKNSHLIRALDDAEKALKDFHAQQLEDLGMSMIACGNALLAKAQLANDLAAELADVALQTFKIRVSSLGVSAAHELTWFGGSALCQKYAQFHPVFPGTTVLLGGSNPQVAVEEDLEPMVSYYLNAAARVAEVESLLKEARAELEAAQGVVSKNKKAA